MSRRQIIILCGVVAVCALGALGWYVTSRNTAGQTVADNSAPLPEIIGPKELRTLGNPRAPVVVIEYAALTCPICAGFSQQVFPAFKAKYIDTGKVFYVYRLYPIDYADGKAEKLASCLPSTQYFSFVDLLYRRQDDWGPEQHNERGAPSQPQTDAGLLQMARIVGMSEDKAKSCMSDTSLDARINKTAADGAARYQIGATPTLIINGKVQAAGPLPMDQLSQLIDPLLAAK